MTDGNDRLQELLAIYNADQSSYRAMFDLAVFMAGFRSIAAQAAPLLIQAFQKATSDSDKRTLLEKMYVAFGYAGDLQNEFTAMEMLARQHPENMDYVLRYAGLCTERGLIEEGSALIGPCLQKNYDNAKSIMRLRSFERPIQVIVEPDELFDAFGEMAVRFDLYVKARILGVAPNVRAICRTFTVEARRKISNPFLLECWRTQADDTIEFVNSSSEFNELLVEHSGSDILLTLYQLPDGRGVTRLPALTHVWKRWYEEGRAPVLRLPDETEAKGRAWLASLGMPEDAWFVCLHLRDGGYKRDPEGGLNHLRNAKPENYGPAIEEITSKGGWVIRIGNPSPHAMPAVEHVFDYANCGEQVDWKDIFLLSKCRFVIGSNSGPVVASQVFGVPAILVDFYPIGHLFGSPQDIVIHKLIRRTATGEILPIREAAAFPLGAGLLPEQYASRGLTVEDNNPEDIVAAVREMFDRIEGRWVVTKQDRERQHFYNTASPSWPYGTGANLCRSFLDRHPELLAAPETGDQTTVP